MSRRVIQPPGGASHIFFGGDEPAQPNIRQKQGNQQSGNGSSNGASQQIGNKAQEEHAVKRQTDESSESSLVQHGGQQESSNAEASRNKDRQKSSLVFGDETAKESCAHNKANQSNRGYNLITGESDQPAAKAPEPAKSVAADVKGDAASAAGATSIKIHHPPGGKSSGPLW